MITLFIGYPDCAKILIGKGAGLNLQNEATWAALIHAASRMKYESDAAKEIIKEYGTMTEPSRRRARRQGR